jgi:hypothetical protein
MQAGFARDDRNSCEFRYDDRPNLVAEFARIPTRGQRISPNQQEKRRGTRPNYGQRWAGASSCAGWVRARRSELLRVPLHARLILVAEFARIPDSRPTNLPPTYKRSVARRDRTTANAGQAPRAVRAGFARDDRNSCEFRYRTGARLTPNLAIETLESYSRSLFTSASR